MFYPLFSLNWKIFISKIIINNYHRAHQKNHIKATMTELSTNSGLKGIVIKFLVMGEPCELN